MMKKEFISLSMLWKEIGCDNDQDSEKKIQIRNYRLENTNEKKIIRKYKKVNTNMEYKWKYKKYKYEIQDTNKKNGGSRLLEGTVC